MQLAPETINLPPNQTAQLSFLPEGRDGILQTLKLMRDLVRQYKTALFIRNLALQITGSLPGKDWRGEVNAIQNWVRNNIRYVHDIRDVETLHTPDVLLQNRAGDCDDQAVLVACLLESIGYATGFMAIGFAPDDFVHVYAIVRLKQSWLSVETTEPVDIGWVPSGIVASMVIYN